MPQHGIRSTYSQCPFQLLTQDQDGRILSSASAFFFETEGDWFLITNWHVVSGRHFITQEPLTKSLIETTSLTAKLASYDIGDRQKGTFRVAPHRIPLYRGEQPTWLEHPKLGASCDVVAIPMNRPDTCPENMHNAANRISENNIPVKPGCTVFIIGFPQAISVSFGLPIWKSGYVASEPHYDVDLGGKLWSYGGRAGGTRIPAFFVDALTRSGMSGSPIFARFHGSWDTRDPYRNIDLDEPGFWQRDDVALFGSEGTMFVGCYSGRVGRDENKAALGLCWRADIIEAICQGRKSGKNPHIIST